MGSVVRQFVRKYGVVIFFPTFIASTIFADWSHTQQWKRSLKDNTLNPQKVKELL